MSKMKVAMRAVILSAVFVMLFAFSAFAAVGQISIDDSYSTDGASWAPHYIDASTVAVNTTATGASNTFKTHNHYPSQVGKVYYNMLFPSNGDIFIGWLKASCKVYNVDNGTEYAAGEKVPVSDLVTVMFPSNSTVTVNVHRCTKGSSCKYEYSSNSSCKKTTTIACTTCGAVIDSGSSKVEYVDHVAGEVKTIAATCSKPAQKQTTCKNCKHVYKTENVAGSELAHKFTVYEKYLSSQHKAKCSECGETVVEAHTLNNSGKCTKCGYKYTGGAWEYMGPVKLDKLNVTALTSNLVNITFTPEQSNRSNGKCKFEIYAGSKKVKTVKNTGKNTYYVTYSAKSASKAKYKVVVVDSKDASRKVASGAKKAVSNNKTVKFSYSMNPRSTQYKSLTVIWRPSKIAKSGNKITVSGAWLDTHIATIKGVKTKVVLTYVGADGKRVAIGTKTLKAKKMKPYYKKSTKWTFKLSAAKLKKIDLKNGGYIDWSSSLLSWGY